MDNFGPSGVKLKPDKVAALPGKWKLPHSPIVVEIHEREGELYIIAVDRNDGEVLSVEDVRVGKKSVSFVLITPSTRWTVNKEIEPQENGALQCTTTTIESWERMA